MFLKNPIQFPFKFPSLSFWFTTLNFNFWNICLKKIGLGESFEITFCFPFSDVECKCVGKLFGVLVTSKLSIVPFNRGIDALNVLPWFEDLKESIIEKKMTKFEPYWRFRWHHHHV
jgi:hypothetical protein